MELVVLDDPRNMNVLGLLLHGYLRHVLTDPALAKRVGRLRGNLCLRAASMWATLSFDGQAVTVLRGTTTERRATVEGELDDLLRLVTGGTLGLVGAAGSLARRRLKLRGDLLFLTRLLPILTAGGG